MEKSLTRNNMAEAKYVKLVGYILPPKTDNADEESENDEAEEETLPEFLDMKEMNCVSSGGFMFQHSAPAAEEVDFMFHGKKERVRGRFPLRNPWWEISCNAQRYSRKLIVSGYPAYKLRTELKNDWRTIVSLFLKECDVDPNFVTRFMEWLPKDRYVDLINIEEALREFGESVKEISAEADYVKTKISKSDAGFHVRAATIYPLVMKHLPMLLPGQFLNLLEKGKEEEEAKEKQQTKYDEENMEASPQKSDKIPLLARLEELIRADNMWKFGFGYIMYKEFRLIRCETKLTDFKSCELFSKMSTEQQNALKVYNEIKLYCCHSGHTYIDRKALEEMMKKMQEVSIWGAIAFLRKHGVLKVEKEKIALRNLYNYENDIAECLHKLIVGEPWKIDLDVREVLHSAERERRRNQLATKSCSSASGTNGEDNESGLSGESASDVHEPMDEEPEATSIELDPDQVRAAEMMCANAVTVISGKGGCGKTTVVSVIFKASMEQEEKNREANDSTWEEGEQKENGKKPVEVLLTAPTGRAASLLSKKTCFTAYTMHQVLWSYMLTKKSPSGTPVDWKFANVRVLVVDEGSLVCVQILSSILSMLTKHAQLQKFIILGDIRQLPSIRPGNVLNDLFASLKRVNWAIEMRTNHRAESELIVQNAGLIADMGVSKKFHHLSYDATVELGKTFTLPSPDKRFIEILLPEKENYDDLQNSIKRLLQGPAPGLKDDASSQFIAFKRKECALINELCCKHYSNHNTKTHKNKMDFQIGDKVCCTRNGYVTDRDKENETKSKEDDMDGNKIKKERLCNGEIFFITQDVTKKEETARKCIKGRYLTLDNKHDKKMTVEYRELMRECKLQHAWARTIHTFQGSEEKTIVYVLDRGIGQTWKHVYTAVTRGQSRVYVIAKKDGLENAIRRYIIKRNTRLEGLIVDLLHNLRIAKREFLSQPSQFQFNTPVRGSGLQTFQSTHAPPSSPGPSQAYSGMMSFKNVTWQNLTNAGTGFGGLSSPKSASPSPCKRDNCTTASKQMKVDFALGCTQVQHLSLNSFTPRQLFPETPQSPQDQ
ncbi:DNA helicase B isoform X1 [Pangasianodon hypophthalmus]|uniref:DNA helicase B isoform X1 n=2 Tax=Pangasianodon hypophthalmus TaxID=310915 RepID=UPI0023082293|nr:DNA helicase B isoform X1 [Pangasianodon hypophthalmus]